MKTINLKESENAYADFHQKRIAKIIAFVKKEMKKRIRKGFSNSIIEEAECVHLGIETIPECKEEIVWNAAWSAACKIRKIK